MVLFQSFTRFLYSFNTSINIADSAWREYLIVAYINPLFFNALFVIMSYLYIIED